MKVQNRQDNQNFGIIRITGKTSSNVRGNISRFCMEHRTETLTVSSGRKMVQYIKTKYGSSQENALFVQIRGFKRNVLSIKYDSMQAELCELRRKHKKRKRSSTIQLLYKMLLNS